MSNMTCMVTCVPWFCLTFFWLNILHSVPWHMGYHWDHFNLLVCTSLPHALFQPHDSLSYFNPFSHLLWLSTWHHTSTSTSSISRIPRIATTRSGISHYVYKPWIRHTWTLGLSSWITSVSHCHRPRVGFKSWWLANSTYPLNVLLRPPVLEAVHVYHLLHLESYPTLLHTVFTVPKSIKWWSMDGITNPLSPDSCSEPVPHIPHSSWAGMSSWT
jgi:hypothetical protein